ncbi:helix-turn-helix transcriptional regulator [Kitasatospora sp. NPDC059571]|uniref:helix-turn-helix transcriptional regulator n=1 Tax=Kitasatospora sp. NPDC059571 TaxID=3346871 RepID=UPI0036A1A49E
METDRDPRAAWTFLTNHARVLSLISRHPDIRMRDLATACQVTERAVQAIVTDLETAGYLTRHREGRRNRYHISPDTQLRHPAEAGHTVASLLALLDSPTDTDTASPPPAGPESVNG